MSIESPVSRADPTGGLIEYVITAPNPVIELNVELEGDGQEGWTVPYKVGRNRDGRNFRAIAINPEVDGTWPLVLTASTNNGRIGRVRCVPGMTVTF